MKTCQCTCVHQDYTNGAHGKTSDLSNIKADALSLKWILFFTVFAQFWSYGSPPEDQQTFPEGPEGMCSFQKAASAILSHLHYLL